MSANPQEERILALLPLVGSILKGFRVSPSVDGEGLFGAGVLALIKAMRAFDPRLGVPLEAYARTRIRGAIQDEMRHMDYLTRTQRQLVSKVAKATRTLQQNGPPPDPQDIAEEAGVTIEDVQFAASSQTPISVDLSGGEWVQDSRQDLVDVDQRLIRNQNLEHLALLWVQLPKRSQDILKRHYIKGTSQTEIAVTLGVHTSRVNQILSKSCQILREGLVR